MAKLLMELCHKTAVSTSTPQYTLFTMFRSYLLIFHLVPWHPILCTMYNQNTRSMNVKIPHLYYVVSSIRVISRDYFPVYISLHSVWPKSFHLYFIILFNPTNMVYITKIFILCPKTFHLIRKRYVSLTKQLNNVCLRYPR